MALVLAAGFHFTGSVQAAESTAALPKVFCADPQTLVANKSALAAGDLALRPALNELLAEADKTLGGRLFSVMDKPKTPPSGDKHDYWSQAPYFWRDTNSPGEKYVNRDGQRNPEAETNSDAGHFADVCYDSHTLALAYYFSGDEKYAAKAAESIRVWFLNPATRMNPNLKYGQGIPGGVEGRAAGLISARGLSYLMDAIGLLAGSKNWQTNDQQQMTVWAGDYFKWLTTSKIGLDEDHASNNHGTYYDVQAVAIALFLGKTDFAREKLLAARSSRIAGQIEPDGKMPRELTRTLSFHYTLFNLDADLQLAALGRNVGVDLWHYQTADGRSILKAAEFMAPFTDPTLIWPYQQIQKPHRNELGQLLLRVTAECPDDKIREALKIFRPEDFSGDTERLYLKMAQLPSTSGKLTAKASEEHLPHQGD
ncbi:MAG TPA: alginate lyase family protein [Verrucomicrobiae bacterium]|nr:alginate lyase family protein [Verrucomicrobiae bacterium]